MENKKVIIRANGAGAFFGTLKEKNGNEVVMNNVRRLWYWDGAASISQIAAEGVTRPSNCKFTVTVNEIIITDDDVLLRVEQMDKNRIEKIYIKKPEPKEEA